MQDAYYFCNGMSEPEKINADDLIVEDNYKGNITEEFIQAHNEVKNYDKEDYNLWIFNDYNVIKNPTLRDFQNINTKIYGLDENQYLNEIAGAVRSD